MEVPAHLRGRMEKLRQWDPAQLRDDRVQRAALRAQAGDMAPDDVAPTSTSPDHIVDGDDRVPYCPKLVRPPSAVPSGGKYLAEDTSPQVVRPLGAVPPGGMQGQAEPALAAKAAPSYDATRHTGRRGRRIATRYRPVADVRHAGQRESRWLEISGGQVGRSSTSASRRTLTTQRTQLYDRR